MKRPSPSPATVAAEWIVRLSDDDPDERRQAHAEFLAWKALDPRHAAAAARMEGLLACSGQLRAASTTAAARHALLRVCATTTWRRRGSALLLALFIACGNLAAAYGELGATGRAYLFADLRSDHDEWQSTRLADGSRVELAAGSAVRLDYSQSERRIQLLRGEALFEVAHDRTRPFLVETEHGSIRALGTRFRVLREDDATILTMLESKVAVTADEVPLAPQTVAAGEQVRIDRQGITSLGHIDAASSERAWQQHLLVAQSQPLVDVLEQLARSRPGVLSFDRRQLAAIQVSAVLPLDDSERALQLLATSFPQLRIRQFGGLLVRIDLQPDAEH